MQLLRAAAAALLAQSLLGSPVAAQSEPAAVGQWSGPFGIPVVAIHLQVLPDGNVLAWGKPETPPIDGGAPVRLFDPGLAQPLFQEVANPFVDVYCSGHAYLGDGRVLVVGGHVRDFVGANATTMFDHRSRSWTNGPRMSAGRWYPTVTTLANGDVLAVSGDVDTTIGVNRLPQVFQAATGTWRDLPDAQLAMPLYPWMHLAPNGKVFNSGPGQVTRYLDTTGSGAWTTVASTNFGERLQYEGTSIMYEPGKVLILGGGNPATNTAEVINLNDAAPAWRYTSPMAFARRVLNATLLPDGKVLVTGGSSSKLFSDPREAVYKAEMWDPATETWSTLAAMRTSRLFHSTAALLPDGRVFVTGGGGGGGDIDHYDAEYFSPPYLFKGARPTIDSAPASAAYAATFTVAASGATAIAGVTLVALSSTTHEFNQSQRFIRLAFTPAAEPNRYHVTAPANANIAPPGYYMLFVLNADGVPSVARMVLLGGAEPGNSPPPSSNGLTGEYYNGTAFQTLVFTRVDPTVDFLWGSASPGPGVLIDGFSVRWTGYVQAPVSGIYTFSTVSNDGVRLWVNGNRIIDNWTVHGTTTNTSAGVALTAGVRYPIRMEFFENGGWGEAHLLWSYPGQARSAIPQTALSR